MVMPKLFDVVGDRLATIVSDVVACFKGDDVGGGGGGGAAGPDAEGLKPFPKAFRAACIATVWGLFEDGLGALGGNGEGVGRDGGGRDVD